MSLKAKIEENFKTALKKNKEVEISTLRMLKAVVFNKEKEKRYKLSKTKPDSTKEELEKRSQLIDEEVIEVISSEIKKRKEAIDLYKKGNRPELAEREKKEIEILQSYLPKQLSEEEIKKIAGGVIEKIGAKGIKDVGKVMAELMPQLKGKADGSLVSKIIKDLLGA